MLNNVISNLNLNPGVCISAILSLIIFAALNVVMYIQHRSWNAVLIIAPICIIISLLLAPVGELIDKYGNSSGVSNCIVGVLFISVVVGIAILLLKEKEDPAPPKDTPPPKNKMRGKSRPPGNALLSEDPHRFSESKQSG